MPGGEIVFVVPGDPVPFARAGSNGKQRFTPRKQADHMVGVKRCGADAMAGREPFAGPVELVVEATYVVPASWSKLKRERAWWKAGKPDVDNLLKIVADSLNGIAYLDDMQIADGRATKRYGVRSETRITIRELA